MIKIFHFKSGNPGPKFLFTAGVHGDEQQPIFALDRWIKLFQSGQRKLLRGEVKIIPRCNPKAFEDSKRWVEVNLNRVVKLHSHPSKYEEYLANILIREIEWCDYMVDMHSYHCADIPFSLWDNKEDQDLLDFVHLAPADYITYDLLNVLAQKGQIDEFRTVHGHGVDLGKKSTVIECGQNHSLHAHHIAVQTVENYLCAYNMIKGEPQYKQSPLVKYHDIVFKEKEGQFVQEWGNFIPVKQGTLIACYVDGEKLFSPIDGVLVLPGPTMPVGADWFWLAEITDPAHDPIE